VDPEGRQESASPSLRGSPTGRAAASSAIIAPDQLASRLGWIDYDLPRIPGLGSRDPGQPGPKLSGPAREFLTGELAIRTLYRSGVAALRRGDARIGAGFGVLHWALSGICSP
jgi:hypothetical protein